MLEIKWVNVLISALKIEQYGSTGFVLFFLVTIRLDFSKKKKKKVRRQKVLFLRADMYIYGTSSKDVLNSQFSKQTILGNSDGRKNYAIAAWASEKMRRAICMFEWRRTHQTLLSSQQSHWLAVGHPLIWQKLEYSIKISNQYFVASTAAAITNAENSQVRIPGHR